MLNANGMTLEESDNIPVVAVRSFHHQDIVDYVDKVLDKLTFHVAADTPRSKYIVGGSMMYRVNLNNH